MIRNPITVEEVLKEVCKGLTDPEIATQLGVSVGIVRSRLEEWYRESGGQQQGAYRRESGRFNAALGYAKGLEAQRKAALRADADAWWSGLPPAIRNNPSTIPFLDLLLTRDAVDLTRSEQAKKLGMTPYALQTLLAGLTGRQGRWIRVALFHYFRKNFERPVQ